MNTARQMIQIVMACVAMLLVATPGVLADTVTLKDGSVLEGEITREGESFIFITIKIGRITQEKMVMRDQITEIKRDEEGGKGDTPAPAKPGEKKDDKAVGDEPGTHPVRVAVLNFGPPSSWQGKAGNMVGVHISADNFESVIPLLEKDKIDIVVIRINSGGGYGFEMGKFHKVFTEYQKKFRTVTWIESAISCAAMSPWIIKEQYMMPQGNIGACTGWYGMLVAVKGVGLEESLYEMEVASAQAGWDPRLMRSMQVLNTPLSASVDPVTGVVTFYDDPYAGDIFLNDGRQILTLTAEQAQKIKFSRGTAATIDELMKVMGVPEYEIAGERAAKKIDDYMMGATRLEKQRDELLVKYEIAIEAAAALQGNENKTKRGAQVGIARRHLNDLRSLINLNPSFAYIEEGGLPPEWFEEQEKLLRDLAR